VYQLEDYVKKKNLSPCDWYYESDLVQKKAVKIEKARYGRFRSIWDMSRESILEDCVYQTETVLKLLRRITSDGLKKKEIVFSKTITTNHPYHLIKESPWPYLYSWPLLALLVNLLYYIHNYTVGLFLVYLSFFTLVYLLSSWWSDVVCEATVFGQHTSFVQLGLRYGMLLFILSEVMFFFSFFWAFFYSSVSPTIQIGVVWPPLGINCLNPVGLPLLNTLLLLLSGFFITTVHHALGHNYFIDKGGNLGVKTLFSYEIFVGNKIFIPKLRAFVQFHEIANDMVKTILTAVIRTKPLFRKRVNVFCRKYIFRRSVLHQWVKIYDQKIEWQETFIYKISQFFFFAIMLGVIFTFIQIFEYVHAQFTIADSVYGSIFYMATGFHGFHVLIGTIFLSVTYYRFLRGDFLSRYFFGVDASIWYWHFVDVVWIFLYIFVYWWGS
jgi:heme/copper-type cytochrome/quinol oxidase subunit 3